MSIEKALIAQAQPQMIAAKARDVIREEICKGCTSDLTQKPVSLEPLFQPLWKYRKNQLLNPQPIGIEEHPMDHEDLRRLRVWTSDKPIRVLSHEPKKQILWETVCGQVETPQKTLQRCRCPDLRLS